MRNQEYSFSYPRQQLHQCWHSFQVQSWEKNNSKNEIIKRPSSIVLVCVGLQEPCLIKQPALVTATFSMMINVFSHFNHANTQAIRENWIYIMFFSPIFRNGPIINHFIIIILKISQLMRTKNSAVRVFTSHQSDPVSILAQRHIWIEFNVRSRLAQRFSSGLVVQFSTKLTFPNFNSTRIEDLHENHLGPMRVPLWIL